MTTTTYYAIYAEDGSEISTGIQSEAQARRHAQHVADTTGRTVYLDTVPSSTDPDDDDDCGEAIEPTPTPTDAQIEALRAEAGAAGDLTMVEICDRALDGDTEARRNVARVIADAQAQ